VAVGKALLMSLIHDMNEQCDFLGMQFEEGD